MGTHQAKESPARRIDLPPDLADAITYYTRKARYDHLIRTGKGIPLALAYLGDSRSRPRHRPSSVPLWLRKLAIGSAIHSLRLSGQNADNSIEQASKKHHVSYDTAKTAYTYYRSMLGLSEGRGRPKGNRKI